MTDTPTPQTRDELEKAFNDFCDEIDGSDEYQITVGRALTMFVDQSGLAVLPVEPTYEMTGGIPEVYDEWERLLAASPFRSKP